MLAIFGERKGAMDQCAIHLKQATEHVPRIGWDVQNHLLKDQQRLLAVDHQIADPALMILDDEEVLGRIFTHNHEVELMHIALNGLKICHPLPLQAAVTITSPVERTVCLQMFSGFSGATVLAQGRKARSPQLRRRRGASLTAPRSPRLRRRRGHSLTCPLPPGGGRGKTTTALARRGGLASAALSQIQGQGNGPLPPRSAPAPGVLPKPSSSGVLPLDPCQRATPSRSPAVGLDCAPHPPG